jgi:hypothetical protein
MIRKLISFVLAGLLTVVPALIFLFGAAGDWKPSGLVLLSLIFSFGVGAMWLNSEVLELFQKKKPPWEEQYALNIYDAFVASGGPGDINGLEAPNSNRSASRISK